MAIHRALWLWLVRQWDKTQSGPFRCLTNRGNFRVNYTDGNKTYWMDYRSASNLAEVFGGKVVHRNQVTN